MSFKSQSQTFAFGESYTFSFPDDPPVSQYLLGISEFCLSFRPGKAAYGVQEMGISLNHNLTERGVTVEVSGTLLSHGVESFDPARSYVTIGIFAWTGTGDDAFTLTNANNFSGASAAAIPVPPFTNINLACMSGFHFAFQNEERDLNQVSARILSTGENPTSVSLDATVLGQKKNATCTGDCGLLALAGNPGVRAIAYQLNSGESERFDPGSAAGKKYAAFMTGFNVAYNQGSIALCSIRAGIKVDDAGKATAEALMTGGEWISMGFDMKSWKDYATSTNRVYAITLEY